MNWRDELWAAWQERWPRLVPVGYRIRASECWVRFHSLPDSKRYADTEVEYEELLRRNLTVLGELAGGDGRPLVVVTCRWSGRPRPSHLARWRLGLRQRRAYWRSLVEDDSEPDDIFWTHLYVERLERTDPDLRRLLRRVADEQETGVIIGPPGWSWLYHPYDGGADVVVGTMAQRDELRSRYSDWLSSHPRGL